MLDFSITPNLFAAFAFAAALPLWLAVLARLPTLRGRNPLQFLLAATVSVAGWAAYVLSTPPVVASDLVLGVMAMTAVILVYLEGWALLSRGYTLALLLTLLQADRPMSVEALARAYRGGQGLGWVFEHRLSGLVRAGLVVRRGGALGLKLPAGVAVAAVYQTCIGLLGLGRTG